MCRCWEEKKFVLKRYRVSKMLLFRGRGSECCFHWTLASLSRGKLHQLRNSASLRGDRVNCADLFKDPKIRVKVCSPEVTVTGTVCNLWTLWRPRPWGRRFGRFRTLTVAKNLESSRQLRFLLARLESTRNGHDFDISMYGQHEHSGCVSAVKQLRCHETSNDYNAGNR